jgi:hypothetical protein
LLGGKPSSNQIKKLNKTGQTISVDDRLYANDPRPDVARIFYVKLQTKQTIIILVFRNFWLQCLVTKNYSLPINASVSFEFPRSTELRLTYGT